AKATGPDNYEYQDTVAVTALSATQLDALLRAKWSSMTDALQRKDIDAALNLMHTSRKSDYQTIVNVLKDQLPAIVANYTGLVHVSTMEKKAWYELETAESGGQFTYRVVFVKDANGLWCIREF
ncbi:MAG: hypothetical protein ABFD82_05690, partial [Syntrophaceae bacterium]